ncbi:ATP-binding protein [Acetobacterium sp.]|uniref:ATP-binding protein n=1 Tax=Acetobacterium sp. TaxID=1872094 RepID=UPI0035942D2D
MQEKHKKMLIGLIIIYALVYLLAVTQENHVLVILLKPGATLFAWFSMRFFTPMMEVNHSVRKTVSYGLLAWFIADLIAMVGELAVLSGRYELVSFFNLEVILYAISRILILVTIAGLYGFVTKKTSQFQVMADMITLVVCMGITVWLVFFKPAPLLPWTLMISGDLVSIFSFFYIVLSLFTQGLLLLNWLYFKERIITIGHKIALTGFAIVSLTDLISAIYPSLIYQSGTIDLAYKAGIILIAIGGVYFNRNTFTQLSARKAKQQPNTWKNGFYFLAYPLFAWHIIGMDIDILIYFLVIAFYMVSCLYTHQIEVTKAVLEKEIASNRELKNQHHFTNQLLDDMPGGIFYVSRDDQLLGLNNKFSRLYGPDTEAYINRNLSEFPYMSKADFREYCQMKEEAMSTGRPAVRQTSFLSANGKEKFVLYSLNVYYLANGRVGGFLGVFTDISEIKEKEKELEIALQNANAATEAKSLFLANMSHEIRTPMNAILGMSHLVMQTELDARQEDYVNKIHGAATALLGIINDILDFSKIESGKLGMETIDFNLEKVIDDTILLFAEKAAARKLEFLVDVPADLPRWYQGDPLRLGQVLTNLVGNAVKFTSAGTIRVTISLEESRENQHLLKFSVRDTGIGIAPNNLERLFEPFTQNDNSITRHYGGTGLGLSISRNLVELMGGNLWAESDLGVGSTFSFTVWLGKSPIAEKAVIDVLYHPEDNSLASLAGLKILVAEDNPVNRQIAEELLRQEGALVDSVENGAAALKRINDAKARDDYDLILMDLQMPVMDGFEATRKIRIINRDIPILAMTARTMADERDECLINGMNDHISKPIDPLLLYHMILKYVKLQAKECGGAADASARTEVRAEISELIEEKSEAIRIEAMKIKEIDWDQVKNRMGNSQELIVTLLTVFAETHPGMAADMETALETQNKDLLKQKMHTAKGVLGNIDATELYQQVCKMEAELLETGMDEILSQDIKNFKISFDHFYSAIQIFIDTQQESSEERLQTGDYQKI